MKYDNCRIILASASPRRRELLARLIPKFDIICADIDESVPCGILPREACRQLAVMKAEAVYKAYPEALVIAADTVVECLKRFRARRTWFTRGCACVLTANAFPAPKARRFSLILYRTMK